MRPRLWFSLFAAVVMVAAGLASPASAAPRGSLDLQAHRGGLGLTTESTLAGFAKALRLGVTTLELDTQITADDKVVVTHDRQVSAQKCQDTGPVRPGDPAYPYVGKFIKDLTLAQIRTMNCGYQQLPGRPEQEQIDGAKIIELRELFDLVKQARARRVMMNIETKVEAGAPHETAPREQFVRRVYEEIEKSGLRRQVTIQSFDWGSLMAMHRLYERLPLVALTNRDFLQTGQPGLSPWLGGIDVDDFGGDWIAAAASIDGVVAVSPVQGFPQDGDRRSGIRAVPRRRHDRQRPRARAEGDSVDGERPGHHAVPDRHRRRRHHHRPARRVARGDGGQRYEAAGARAGVPQGQDLPDLINDCRYARSGARLEAAQQGAEQAGHRALVRGRQSVEQAALALQQVGQRAVDGLAATRRERHQHAAAIVRIGLALDQAAGGEAVDAIGHRAGGDVGLGEQPPRGQPVGLAGAAQRGQDIELPAGQLVRGEGVGPRAVEPLSQAGDPAHHLHRRQVQIRPFAGPCRDDAVDLVCLHARQRRGS